MIKILNKVRNYEKRMLGGIDETSWTGYDEIEWTCDLCGKQITKKIRNNSYGGFTDVGFDDYPERLAVDYGKYNKRKIFICPTHGDSEIEKKLEELKD